MSKSIGIIQPGRLGDIIICLPIAAWYAEQGYKVVWPVFHTYIHMLQEVVDYVQFIPVTTDVYTCVAEAYSSLHGTETIDIAATFPGSVCTDAYVQSGDGLRGITFDQFKYDLANVPFEMKWQLKYNRNHIKEQQIVDELVKQQNYDIVGLSHSRGRIDITIDSPNQIIHTNTLYNIFHWRKILEGAKCIALVDSAMSNFVEALQLSNRRILIVKEHPARLPSLRNGWIIKTP